MWRAILLGKLAVSIIASLIVGVICGTRTTEDNVQGMVEFWQWRGLGLFFLVLAVAQIAAIFLMLKKKRFDA